MSKKNGNGMIYKDGNVYLDGKLIGIGFKDGEHVPRASDYKLPKKLSKSQKERIETTRAILEEFRKVRERESKSEK